jgi:hypothetical protein
MAKNSAIVKIIPMIDQKKMKEGVKQLSAMNKVANIGLGLAKVTGKVALKGAKWGGSSVAGMLTLGALMSKNTEYLENMSSLLDTVISQADYLSTISADLGSMSTSSGAFALTSAVMESQGIDQAGRDKLIASLQDKMASGELMSGENQTLESVLSSLQKQWQEAKASGNMAKAKQIEDTVGLRGKQASEFLQGNLGKDKSEIARLVGLTEKQLTEQIEANAKLEGVQAQTKAVEQLKLQGAVSKAADKGTIKSMAELENFKTRQLIEIFGSFDNMAEAEKTKHQVFLAATRLFNSLLAPFAKVRTPEEFTSTLRGEVKKGLESILNDLVETWKKIGMWIADAVLGSFNPFKNKKSEDSNAKDLKKEDNRGRI